MRLDADDLVSNRLVEYAGAHSISNGWIISRGWIYPEGSDIFIYRWNLHMRCASTHIVRLHDEDFPTSMDTVDSEWLADFWQHQKLANSLIQIDRRLDYLRWPGVVYVVGHAASLMGQGQFHGPSIKERIWRRAFTRRLDERKRREFSVVPLGSITIE